MSQTRARQALVLTVATALVLAPMVGAVSGIASTQTGSETTYSATDKVDVWERSPLPFRLNTGDATKTIQNGALNVEYEPENAPPVSLNKQEIGVYETGTTINAKLGADVDGAPTSDFEGQETQLVVARLEPDTNTESMDALPSSLGDLDTLLDPETGNENASFTVKSPGSVTSGSVETSFTPDQAGAYVTFLATYTGNKPFATDAEDNLSVTDDATIIGMDSALVEESPADVTAENEIEPGEDASFTVTPKTDSASTNVSVVLYDRSTWTDSKTILRVTEPVDSSFSAENITINHSIKSVNGVADVDGSVSVLGQTLGDAQRSGVFSIADTIEFLTAEANDETDSSVTQPKTVATDDTVLDASVVAKTNINQKTTIKVPTFGNWSDGTYVWVVTTGGNDAGDIHTKTGDLTVETDTGGGGNNDNDDDPYTPPRDDDDDDDDDGDGDSPEVITDPPTDTPSIKGVGPGSTVTERAGGLSANLTSATPNTPVVIQVPVNETELEQTGYGVSGMNLSFGQNASGTINVSSTTDPGVSPVSQGGDLGYFEISHTIANEDVSSATYEFSVSKQRLADRGLDTTDVALYRYEDNGWTELDTRHLGSTETAHQFEADSPGLSTYAISQRGAAQANIGVTEAAVSTTDVQVGEDIEVTATIENQGSAAGEFTANLDVDGRTLDSKTVELGAGEQTTVTFMTSFETADDYTVSVSGVTAGAVSVTAQDTTTTPPTTTTTTDDTTTPPAGDGDDGGSTPLIWVGVLLVIAALGAGVYLYTQGYFDDEDQQL
jgi:hypothetical protein